MDLKLEKELEFFKINWAGAHVTQDDDRLVYKTAPGFAKKAAARSNLLIEALGLDLIATPTTLQANDSFTIKIKQNG